MHHREITFVTQNKNKIDDARRLLPEYTIKHVDFEIPEIQSLDPRVVIEHKLHLAYKKIQEPCFVVDVSLMINGLNGFPGPLIKWFWEQVGLETVAKIVAVTADPRASFVTTLGYHNGETVTFFESTIEGKIAPEPRGNHGYAWDPIFIPQGSDKTFAEMTFEEKHTYTMTTKVLSELHEYITHSEQNN